MFASIVVYTKPDCPLCHGLIQKLRSLPAVPEFKLELRDITTCEEWQARYQFSIPVLIVNGRSFPRPAPQVSPERLALLLKPALENPPCLSSSS